MSCFKGNGNSNTNTKQVQSILDQNKKEFDRTIKILLLGAGESGKCFERGTKIMKYDGTIVPVEEIIQHDILMGDYSEPRRVLLPPHRGFGQLYCVSTCAGDKYVVNGAHILCLKEDSGEDIIELSVNDFLALPRRRQLQLKWFRSPVEFPDSVVDFDPYMLGFCVCSDSFEGREEITAELKQYMAANNLYQRKCLPLGFRCNSREKRMRLLRGILDSNSCSSTVDERTGGILHELSFTERTLADDVVSLMRSLGLCPTISNVENDENIHFFVQVADVENPSPQALRSSLEIRPAYYGEYFGFSVDGNHRFLLGDYSVVHNSTTFKQLKILYVNGFSKDELLGIRETVRDNVVNSMKSLLTAIKQRGYKLQEEHEKNAKMIFDFPLDQPVDRNYNAQIGVAIAELWKDEAVQKAFQFRSEFQLLDSTEYFFNEIDRISEVEYSPTVQDMIRCRIKTTGIVSIDFEYDNFKYKLTDVGGQRSERRKWMHCFDDANALLFVVALSEYDLKCYEDGTTPRMNESLLLFEEICNNKFFANVPIVLLLNKNDLFTEKIKRIPLKVWDPEFKGEDGNYEAAISHIKGKFLEKNTTPERTIDVFVCTSIETETVKNVFEQVRKSILKAKGVSSV